MKNKKDRKRFWKYWGQSELYIILKMIDKPHRSKNLKEVKRLYHGDVHGKRIPGRENNH